MYKYIPMILIALGLTLSGCSTVSNYASLLIDIRCEPVYDPYNSSIIAPLPADCAWQSEAFNARN